MITALIGHLPFWQIYGLLFSGGLVFVFILSVPLFLPLYKWQPTKGQVAPYKTLLRYPSDSTIRSEIYWAIIGLTAGVLCPAISTYLSFRGQNMMYSNIEQYGWGYWALSCVMLFFFNELYEYAWHRACHTYKPLWELHKIHHNFHNPSPISVISNHPLDLFVQASPLLVVPFIFPIHDLTLFLTFALMNYAYGAYLHSGFDFPTNSTSPHNKYFITNYHHVMHHARSHFGKPLNTGFVLSIFDKMFGTFAGPEYFAKDGQPCPCAECRPKDAHKVLEKPSAVDEHNELKEE